MIYEFFKNRKANSLNYITEERKNWRNTIRQISEKMYDTQFNGSGKRDIKKYISILQNNINSYGKYNKYSAREDGYIWDSMERIESAETEEEFDNEKKILLYYISLMLKNDWERSKEEVRGFSFVVFYIISSVLNIVVTYFVLFEIFNINNVKNFIILFVFIIIISNLSMMFIYTHILTLNPKKEKDFIMSSFIKKEKYKRSIPIKGVIAIYVVIILGLIYSFYKDINNNIKIDFTKKEVVEIHWNLKYFPGLEEEISNKKINKENIEEIIKKIQIDRVNYVFFIWIIFLFVLEAYKIYRFFKIIDVKKKYEEQIYKVRIIESYKVEQLEIEFEKIINELEYREYDNKELIDLGNVMVEEMIMFYEEEKKNIKRNINSYNKYLKYIMCCDKIEELKKKEKALINKNPPPPKGAQ